MAGFEPRILSIKGASVLPYDSFALNVPKRTKCLQSF